MDAGRRHAGAGRVFRVKSPVALGEREKLVVAEVGFDLEKPSETALLRLTKKIGDRGFEAPFVAHPEDQLAGPAQVDGPLRLGFGQRQRLLAEYMFPRRYRPRNLGAMEGMWRRQDHRFDVGVGENVLVAVGEAEVLSLQRSPAPPRWGRRRG